MSWLHRPGKKRLRRFRGSVLPRGDVSRLRLTKCPLGCSELPAAPFVQTGTSWQCEVKQEPELWKERVDHSLKPVAVKWLL